jgi:ribosomal protein S18 acetylase RimI-like enzyme
MSAVWVVRRAEVSDAPRLAELAAATFPLACPPQFDPAAVAAHIRRRLSVDAFRINIADVGLEYTVAEQTDGRAVGYLLLAQGGGPVAGRRLLEVRQLYVRPELHGSGLADALMDVAVQRARALGQEGLWLGTSKVNGRAIAFYRRHGFGAHSERVFLVHDVPNEDWVMVRRFGPIDSAAEPRRSGV